MYMHLRMGGTPWFTNSEHEQKHTKKPSQRMAHNDARRIRRQRQGVLTAEHVHQ